MGDMTSIIALMSCTVTLSDKLRMIKEVSIKKSKEKAEEGKERQENKIYKFSLRVKLSFLGSNINWKGNYSKCVVCDITIVFSPLTFLFSINVLPWETETERIAIFYNRQEPILLLSLFFITCALQKDSQGLSMLHKLSLSWNGSTNHVLKNKEDNALVNLVFFYQFETLH